MSSEYPSMSEDAGVERGEQFALDALCSHIKRPQFQSISGCIRAGRDRGSSPGWA
jgi:hypothetical protein